MNKKINKITATLLIIATFFTSVPVSVKAAEVNVFEVGNEVAKVSEKDIMLTSKRTATFLQESSSSDYVELEIYKSFPFYGRSEPELKYLYSPADAISIVGYCDGDEIDETLIAYITAEDEGNDFAVTIPFKGNGNLITIPYYVPMGEYEVLVTGRGDIRKSNVFIGFSAKVR